MVMKSMLAVLLSILIPLQSLAGGKAPPAPSPTPVPTLAPTPTPIPSPATTGYFHYLPVNATQTQIAQLQAAELKVNQTIQTQCFRDFMVKRALIQTNGKTNTQVVDHLQGVKLDLPSHFYYDRFSRVVGYRQPPKPDLHFNTKFWAGATSCNRASNMAHEGSHTAGYGHDYKASTRRPYSVPYSINMGFALCCVH